MVWSCCLVCVCEPDGQCLASWPQCCHFHQATTHAPHRVSERGVDGARKTVEGEGTADGVEMVGQTSESQAPQQWLCSNNSHQVKPHGGTRCNTTTKSHCSATPTHQVPPTNNSTQGSHKATKPQQSEAPTTMLLPSHTHTGSGPTRQPHQKAHGDGDGGKRGATPQARGQPWLITRGVLPCHNPLTSGPHTHTRRHQGQWKTVWWKAWC